MTKDQVTILLNKYIAEELTQSEFEQLWATLKHADYTAEWQKMADKVFNKSAYATLSDPAKQRLILTRILKSRTAANAETPELEKTSTDAAFRHIMAMDKYAPTADFKSAASELPDSQLPPVYQVHFLKTIWFRYAAVVLLIAGASAFLYRVNHSQKGTIVTTATEKPTDILPGGNKAILTLSDGSTIVLDSASVGTLASEGGTNIEKSNAASLTYHAGATSGEALYNTITTPKGGQYQVTLPDGSKVWLNAASSITFPTTFGKDRTVEITGESYLEVAANKNAPFFVKTKTTTIQVLGTSFNVNLYNEKADIRTTLLEGSVKVVGTLGLTQDGGTEGVILKPGQQAQIKVQDGSTGEIKVQKADIEKVMAWKNGVFNFEGASLEEVMRQLELWYDITVEYRGNIPVKVFKGKLSRDLTLSQVLRILEVVNIHLEIDGRKLIVTI